MPEVTIKASIPGLPADSELPAHYTCDGADVSPPVTWTKIPAGTAEIALFLANLRPVHGKLFIDWAVLGLNPKSKGVATGALPAGAVVGRNSFGKVGYSICPAKGTGKEGFILKVLALPHRLVAKPGFDAKALLTQVESTAKATGFTGGTYTRP